MDDEKMEYTEPLILEKKSAFSVIYGSKNSTPVDEPDIEDGGL